MKRNGIYFKNEWLVSKYYKQSDSSDRASNPGLTWKRNWVSSDHNRKKKKKEKRTKVMVRGGLVSIHAIKPTHLKALPAEPSVSLTLRIAQQDGSILMFGVKWRPIKKLSRRDLSREEPFVFPLLLAVLISTCLITSLRNMINGGYLCFVMECPA